MSPKEALDKIQLLFTQEVAKEVVEVSFKEYATKDGKKVEVDSLEVGGNISSEGNPVSGDTLLADGTLIVSEDGKITEIKLPELEEEMKDLNKEAIEKLSSDFAENKNIFDARIVELSDKLTAQEVKFGKAIVDLCSLVEGLMATPSVETKKPSEKFKLTESKQDKISRFLEMAKQIKK